MEKLRAKLKNQGGFTLIEMLIVVAIIAILIAVSIPLVAGAMESAREATDAANERAFKGALVSSYLLSEAGMNNDDIQVEAGTIYAYDAVNGKVSSDKITDGYGQSVATSGSSTADCQGKVLYGTVSDKGEVKMTWDEKNKELAGVTIPTTPTLVNPDIIKGS